MVWDQWFGCTLESPRGAFEKNKPKFKGHPLDQLYWNLSGSGGKHPGVPGDFYMQASSRTTETWPLRSEGETQIILCILTQTKCSVGEWLSKPKQVHWMECYVETKNDTFRVCNSMENHSSAWGKRASLCVSPAGIQNRRVCWPFFLRLTFLWFAILYIKFEYGSTIFCKLKGKYWF